jgi:hypothetical protein
MWRAGGYFDLGFTLAAFLLKRKGGIRGGNEIQTV